MIDAQAVSAHLDKLQSPALDHQGASPLAGLGWLQDFLQQVPVQQDRDEAGNYWITLPGKSERAVVLGSYVEAESGNDPLDSRLGLVTGLETIKALAHRFEGHPPCTVQLVVWVKPGNQQTGRGKPGSSALVQDVAAYLELHIESGEQLESAGTPLGVVTAASDIGSVAFSPRLMALCDEAVRELTGTSASLPSGPNRVAAEMAGIGIPTAVMCVQAPTGSADQKISNATRLHLLQAAEAFGRWAESTIHLVAGEEVDLWARGSRVPHS